MANNKQVNFSFTNRLNSKLYEGSFFGSINTKDLNKYFEFKPIQGLVDYRIDLNNVQIKNTINVNLDLTKSQVNLKTINYNKDLNVKGELDFKINKKSQNDTVISNLTYIRRDTKINLLNLSLDKNYKIQNFKSIKIKTKKNSLNIKKNNKNIVVNGNALDLREFIKLITSRKNRKKTISKNFNANVEARIKLVYIGNDTLSNVVASGVIKKGKYDSLNIFGSFSEKETASVEIKRNKKNNLETRIISDRSKPVLSGIKFTQSFSNGKLKYISEKFNESKSKSTITLNNFYVKKMPILANLLSLTSFTGLIDTLSGKGVFFEKSYLEYATQNKNLKIVDAYGTGDSLGYILEGSINKNGFVSIKGNLVPAYLVNDLIRQIPILGKVITGKQGDGIFGASFKLKGQSNSLKTTVNPIKTLTPRFIQRFFALFKKKSK